MSKLGLIESFNFIREHASQDYQNNVSEINENTSIETFVAPLLDYPKLFNEFAENLLQRIVYTQFLTKKIKNPLKVLEGDKMPIGYAGQEIYVNAAIGRDYDPDDFAGLLKKYEADCKVQYQGINFDKQYPVTIIRQKLKQAFVSWNALGEYISELTKSLYDGFYIDEYNNTKAIVTRAYLSNAVQIEKVTLPTDKETAENFTELARTIFLNFQTPTHEYNAWKKIGGYGRFIETMTPPEEIVFLLRNDIRSKLDVTQLANAFNMDKAILLGNMLPVNDFSIYDRKTGKLLLDGSNILGIICDKSWFRIKEQDLYMDEGKNANNRSINYYLNAIKEFNYSYFANAVVFATNEPETPITALEYENSSISLVEKSEKEVTVKVTPAQANTPSITYESSDTDVATVEADSENDRICVVTGVSAGTAKITATAGNITSSFNVTVTANE